MTIQYSVSDLETRAMAIISEARITKEPVCISQNGHAAVLLVDADTYLTQMQALREFERIFRDESSIRPASAQQPQSPEPVTFLWRCKKCGYQVEAEALPEGFICPKCGGSHITVNDEVYTFGVICNDFYFSGELAEYFPLKAKRFADE